MVCPYCGTRAIPTAIVCTNCGAILKGAKVRKRPSKPVPWRRLLFTLLGYIIAAAAMGYVGHLAARFLYEDKPIYWWIGFGAGVLIGLMIMFLVSSGSVFFQSNRLNGRRRKIQGELKKIEQNQEKKLEGAGKAEDGTDQDISPETRLEVAAVHLIEGQVDESLAEFEQVYKLGMGTRADFLNNCGVAFARRGQTQLSVDRFQKAIEAAPEMSEPRVNLVFSVAQTGDKSAISKVLASQNGTLTSSASRPDVAGRIGITYAAAGQAADAQKVIEGVIKKGGLPRDVMADGHNDLGVAKAMAKKYREANVDFQRAIALDAGHASAMANMGVVYYNQGRYDDAAERCEAALIVDPHNGIAHTILGAAYSRMNLINEGIREFRDARLHEMYLYEPNYNLGKTYIEQDITDEAEKYLARAYEINPYSWQTLVAQAVLLFKKSQIDRSKAVFLQALQVRPDEVTVLAGLALCYTIEGQYFDGEDCFERAIKASPNSADLKTNYSWHNLIRSDIKAATKLLEESLLINKKAAVACNNMGLCQMEMGANDAAMQYFKQAIHTDPTLGSVYYNLGNNYITQKAVENAVDAWEKAKPFEQGNADLPTNLGVAYYKLGKFDKALIEFRRVLILRQEKSDDYANLGLTLARMKRHTEAIEQFDLALQIEPLSPMLHSNRGLACYFANRVEDAMAEWQQVTRINRKYAEARGKKQQSEYDDASIDYVPLYISERALHTAPKIPDFVVTYVPGYATSQWELMLSDDNIKRLQTLKGQRENVDRRLRALKL